MQLSIKKKQQIPRGLISISAASKTNNRRLEPKVTSSHRRSVKLTETD